MFSMREITFTDQETRQYVCNLNYLNIICKDYHFNGGAPIQRMLNIKNFCYFKIHGNQSDFIKFNMLMFSFSN